MNIRPARVDEGPHDPRGELTFTESWAFEAVGPTGPDIHSEVGLRPGLGDCWFVARITGPGDMAVVVVDQSLPVPRPPRLELRAPGLWADHVIEEPLQRWSLGLEAFGVAVPLEELSAVDLLDPDLRGERTPVGWELEWESTEPASWDPAGVGGYSLKCRVHGEVLIGTERHELEAVGLRRHRWGS